jgi:hypothetical protein
MKVSVAAEWSLLSGFMKANFNKKYEAELHYDKYNPNSEKTGDYFYDHIGKFCNNDITKQ